MAGNLGHIAATASLNIDPFQQSTRVLQTQIRSLDSALKAQELSFKNNGKGISGLKTVYDQTGRSVTSYSALLETQKKKYNDLKEEIGDVSKASDDQKTKLLSAESAMNKTAGQVDALTNKYNTLGKEIAIQDSKWTKVGNSLDVIGTKAKKVGDNLSSFGSSMTKGVTLPIVGGVALAVKSAIDFESAFAGVKKTVDEVVDTNGNVLISYEDLSAGIREMSKELPASASEIATVAESAGQLGIQTKNVLAFSKTMIDMGESTNLGATDAATALARFANITGMSQDKFTNLGASIVELGNNYATTESEIVAMSVRLAGAGSQIGMSEADILGLSAALSSVGIEAEAGGSAFSKIMVEMQLATKKGVNAFEGLQQVADRNGISWDAVTQAYMDGGKELTNMSNKMGLGNKGLKDIYKVAEDAKAALGDFGYVAGMSGDEFAAAFEEDAVGAIAAFVQGLGKAEDKGITAIEMLDNMGISEIRLRDALLRAGNASDLFTDAIKTSNSAFEENTALTDEANKRYETTEAKLGMLRNQVTDVAIEFGGPFVDALREGLTAATPLIQTLGNLASKFSEASPETQQMIVKTLAFTAAIGPVSSVLGKVISVGGSGISVVGKLAKQFGIISGTATASATAIGATTATTSTLSAGMIGATGSATGLVAGLGAIAPALLIVGGAVALGTIAWKTWGEDAYEASERTRKWGSDVGEAADKALTEFQVGANGMQDAMYGLELGIEGSTEAGIESTNNMLSVLKGNAEGTKTEMAEVMAALPEYAREMAEDGYKEQQEILDKQVALAEEYAADINEIYTNLSEQNREATTSEKQEIINAQIAMSATLLDQLKIYGHERVAIESTLNGEISNMTVDQANKQAIAVREQIDTVKAGYKEQSKAIEAAYNDGLLDTEEYNKSMANLNGSNEEMMDRLIQTYIELGEQGGTTEQTMRGILNELGYNYDDFTAKVEQRSKEVAEYNGLIAKSSYDMSVETQEANQMWNNLEFYDKEGKLKSNTEEIVADWVGTEEGWENLLFVAKNADLTTNSKQTLAEGIVASEKWNNISYVSLQALVESNSTKQAIQAVADNGMWSDLTYEQMNALVASNSPEQVRQALVDNGTWDAMTWEQRELILENEVSKTVVQSLRDNGTWGNLSWATREAILTSNTPAQVKTALIKSGEWNNLTWKERNAIITTNAWDTAGRANAAIATVKDKTVKITTRYITVGNQEGTMGGPKQLLAKGTKSHIGGKAWLGDGGKHEPWLTPQGDFGISPNDWTLYDLPKGTKVWPSIEKFNSEIPRFANGTDIADTRIMRTMSMLSNQTRNASNRQVPSNNIETVRESSSGTTKIEGNTYNLYLTANGELPKTTINKMAKIFQQAIKNENDRKKMSRGEVVTL